MRTCLFDLDGTLIDSIGLIVGSFRHTVAEFGKTVPPDEVFVRGIGLPLTEQLGAFASDAKELDAMREVYSRFYIDNHNDRVRAFPGVAEALKTLKASGCPLGIITSKVRVGALRALNHCQLADYFDVIVGADDTEKNKPHPDPVYYALDQLDRRGEPAVFVGDSPHDMEAGRAAGVAIAAVSWGPFETSSLQAFKPEHWLATTADIASLGNS